jgi:transcriptional regulator with XRE-family HTH domain
MLNVMARPISAKLERRTDTPERAFGWVITGLRVTRKWSQQDLSDKSGYSVRYLNQVERGTRNPCLRLIRALAGALGVSPGHLLTRAENLYLKHQGKRR